MPTSSIERLISYENDSNVWKKMGSRAVYLSLYANQDLSYDKLRKLHELVLKIFYVYA